MAWLDFRMLGGEYRPLSTTTQQLIAQLEDLGLRRGDAVMVHAGLRKLGDVEARGDGLLDAIEGVLGPTGTMLMTLGAQPGVPFDALRTPVDTDEMGVLAELFRRRPATLVSDHVDARFGAAGARAEELVADPPLDDYLGPGSALERFVAMGGRVLRIGADIDTVTLTHLAEYYAKVPNKRRVRRRHVRADTGVQWVECLDDCEGIVDWDDGDYFSQILLDFFASGGARRGSVGAAEAELFDAAPFVDFATRWMNDTLG